MSDGRKKARRTRPEWPALWAMVFRARAWSEMPKAKREPMKWMPSDELIRFAVRKRLERIPAHARPDLQTAIEAFTSELTWRMVPHLQAENPPTLEELRWVFDSPLLHCGRKPAGPPIVLAEERKSAGGEQVKCSLEAAEEQAALALHEDGEAADSWMLPEELGRFNGVLMALYGLSKVHAAMILELFYLGGVATPAWKAHLQHRRPGRSPNAHNQELTRHKYWAIFRFLVLLVDLEGQYQEANAQVQPGDEPDGLGQKLAELGCSADVAWRCFTYAYMTRGVTYHVTGLELGTAKLGVSDETYRAARDAVARWALLRMERNPAVQKILAKYRPRIERRVLGFGSPFPSNSDEE